jgi:hypothetical protein
MGFLRKCLYELRTRQPEWQDTVPGPAAQPEPARPVAPDEPDAPDGQQVMSDNMIIWALMGPI